MSPVTATRSMQVVHDLDTTIWRRFVECIPGGNIFHTPEMFAVFGRTENHSPELWAVVDDTPDVLALLTPVQVSLGGGLMRLATTRAIAYGSVVCKRDPSGREALRLLLSAYMRRSKGGSLFTELRNSHDLSDLREDLEDHGFRYESHLNYLIDLDRPPAEIFSAIRKRTRTAIRRELRSGRFKISEVTTADELGPWYSILAATYQKARVPLADRSLFEAALDVLGPRGMVRFVLASIDGAPVACSAELQFKGVVYAWYGGTIRSYSQHVPTEFLLWHIIEHSAALGYSVYDFGGAGQPNEPYGVRDFKAKFRGELVDHGRFTAVHSRSRLHLSRLGYAIYQKAQMRPGRVVPSPRNGVSAGPIPGTSLNP